MSRLAFSAAIGAFLLAWFLAPGFDFDWDGPDPVPGCPSTVECRTPAPSGGAR